MEGLFSIESLFTLLILTLLQAVLGFDNLLYISIESKRVKPELQSKVRKLGITLAIVLRIALLFGVMSAIEYFQKPFFSLHFGSYLYADFTVHSLIVLLGGAFIIYTAIKEIFHMLRLEEAGESEDSKQRSFGTALFWIIMMNLVFSFDSILSAIALTEVFAVMAIAIVISGVLMIVLADKVSEFLKKNRMYEVLGLFILFIVGIMLVSEGGHLAHLSFFELPVEPMTKTTFYFTLAILVIVDVVQSKYQKRLLAKNL